VTMATASGFSDQFRIRYAETSDVAPLVQLINLAFVVEQIAISGDRVDADRVRAYLDRGRFLLLEDGTALVGCVYVELRADRGYVGLLSVEPRLQMKGLGRPELLRFYGKLGFAETGISPMPADAPLKMACHFIHLSKPLG